MLEVYSDNVTVASAQPIPLNSTSIQKGCTATRAGVSTIQLNNCGVYEITLDGNVIGADTEDVIIQMTKDGVPQPQAITSAFAYSPTSLITVGFTTLVQVDHNNTKCCCTSPVLIEFLNSGIDLTDSHINVTVTKLC